MGNLVSYLRAKSESKSVTPDTAFHFNSKDVAEKSYDANPIVCSKKITNYNTNPNKCCSKNSMSI
jgi:hypothetical protein